jgi:hypothetical protein
MAKISLAGPSYTLQSVVAAAQQTMNLIPEIVEAPNEPTRMVLNGRPGIEEFTTVTPPKIRCLWTGGGRLFVVHGGVLSEVSESGTVTARPGELNQGTIDPDPAQIFSNSNQLMIISGGSVYIDNGAGPQPARYQESGTGNISGSTLIRTSGPGFNLGMEGEPINISGQYYTVVTIVSGDQMTVWPDAAAPEDGVVWYTPSGAQLQAVTGGFLDGYFIVNQLPVTPDFLGRNFNISGLMDGTVWDPLMYAVKEGHSDYIRSILCDHEQLWLFGTETIEVWQNTGNADFPFERIPGAYIQTGSMAAYAPCSVGSYVCWLAGGPYGETVAVRARGFEPERISTHAQEESWNAPGFRVDDAVSYAYLDAGHLFWIVNFWQQQKTWVYDMTEGLWHERAGWNATTKQFTRYQPWFHAFVPEWGYGKHIVGDPVTGKLYEASLNFHDDAGLAIQHQRAFPHLLNENKFQFHHRLELYMETGTPAVGDPAPLIGMDWSDDRGHTFAHGRTANIGVNGEYTKRIVWRRLGKSRDRVYRVGVESKSKVALIDAFLEVTPGGA